MAGELRGHRVREPRRRHLLDEQLVQHAAEIGGEAQRLGRLDRATLARFGDEAGKHQLAVERIDRRRDLRGAQRIERGADRLVQRRIADRDEPRQQQAAFCTPDERVADRARGAVVGQQHQPARERQPVPAGAREQPGGKRIGEAAVQRHRVDLGLRHLPFLGSGPGQR